MVAMIAGAFIYALVVGEVCHVTAHMRKVGWSEESREAGTYI